MKNKRIAVILIILIIVIIVILGFLCANNKKTKTSNDYKDDFLYNVSEIEGKVYQLDTIEDYFLIKNCLNKYYLYYLNYYQNNSELSKEQLLSNLYYLLSDDYKKEKGITLDNINELYTDEINDFSIILKNVKYVRSENEIYTFFINFDLFDEIEKVYSSHKNIVIIDRNNCTFSISLEDYLLDYDFDKIIVNSNVKIFDNNIPVNEINKFGEHKGSFNEFVKDKFNDIREYILYDSSKAYSMIYLPNSQIKSEFQLKEFVKDNYSKLFKMDYSNYELKYIDNHVVYECNEKYNNFMISIYADDPTNILFTISLK